MNTASITHKEWQGRKRWDNHRQYLRNLPEVLDRASGRRMIMAGDFNQQLPKSRSTPCPHQAGVGHMREAMDRITVTIDQQLIEEARQALCTSTKRETIELVLREAVKASRRAAALSRAGRLDLELDQEGLAELRRQP